MEVSTLRRLASGLGANGYSQLVTIVVQLMGVPIFLNAWGPRLYGEWLILFAIPAYFSISDLGFSQSAANDMTGRVARHDVLGALAVNSDARSAALRSPCHTVADWGVIAYRHT